MRWLAGLFALALFSSAASGQNSEGEELAALLRANSWPIVVTGEGLAGPGANRIAAWADDAQFFLLGEDHGSAGLARFATALSRTLGAHGYRYTAIEVDPLMTELMVRKLRQGRGAYTAYLADGRQRAIPFYSWSEEADFIDSAIQRGPIWGLDQSFVAAAPVHLDEIARRTRNASVRALANALAAEARADPNFLGKVDIERLRAMRVAMPDNDPAKEIADQLIESAIIYAPFFARPGSIYASNLRRETQMKRFFLRNVDDALRRDGKPPKVLLKFGANHLARGLSPTHVQSLGNFLMETAPERFGKSAFNLQMICGTGGAVATYKGEVIRCGAFDKAFPALTAFIGTSGATLFDLRPLRDHPKLWKDWSQDAQELVWTYDAIVVITDGGPSHLLAPTPKPPG